MQLGNTKNLIPITLASGLFLTGSSFTYADFSTSNHLQIDNKTIVDKNISNYLEEVDNNDAAQYSSKLFFLSNITKWEKETMFLSSANSIIENKHFKAIIGMGDTAVPFILEEIDKEPSTLVWALNMIYKRKVSNNPNLTITQACKRWIKELS